MTQSSQTGFLRFVECAGCGELFPVRNPHAVRAKWCSEKCRKKQYTDIHQPCAICGAPTSSGPLNGYSAEPHCDSCRRELLRLEREARDADVIALRAEGRLNTEIAQLVDSSAQSVGARVYRIRERGGSVARTIYPLSAARSRSEASPKEAELLRIMADYDKPQPAAVLARIIRYRGGATAPVVYDRLSVLQRKGLVRLTDTGDWQLTSRCSS